MIIEISADGAAAGEVFRTLWNDAIGAFSGDFRDKIFVHRATLTGIMLEGLAWVIFLLLPICAVVVVTLVREPEALPSSALLKKLRLLSEPASH